MRADRFAGHQEGVKICNILVGYFGEVGIGEGRIQMRPGPGNPFTHGPRESFFGPLPDTGFRVRGNIGGVDSTERRWYGQATGKRLPGIRGMTGLAIAQARQHFAAVNLILTELSASRRFNRINRRFPGNDQEQGKHQYAQAYRSNQCFLDHCSSP